MLSASFRGWRKLTHRLIAAGSVGENVRRLDLAFGLPGLIRLLMPSRPSIGIAGRVAARSRNPLEHRQEFVGHRNETTGSRHVQISANGALIGFSFDPGPLIEINTTVSASRGVSA